MRRIIELCEMFDNAPLTETYESLDLKLNHIDFDTNEKTLELVMAGAQVKEYFDSQYFTRQFVTKKDNEVDALNEFMQLFQNWLNNTRPDWDILWSGFQVQYNPIENYDRRDHWTDTPSGEEKNATTYKGTEKNNLEYVGKEMNTLSKTGNDTESISRGERNSNTQDNSTTFDDVSTGSNTTGSILHEDANADTNTTSYNSGENSSKEFENRADNSTRTFENRSDETSKTFTNRVDTHEGRVHGLIGVMTGAQALKSEIDVRAKHLVYEILDQFIDKFTFIGG